MVIQPNMSPKSIVEVWGSTEEVFNKNNVTITDKALESLFNGNKLASLIDELNIKVGSSDLTCTEGG